MFKKSTILKKKSRPGRGLAMREMREGRKCYGWPKVDNRFCQYRSLRRIWEKYNMTAIFIFAACLSVLAIDCDPN
jgi:hypothetical protein